MKPTDNHPPPDDYLFGRPYWKCKVCSAMRPKDKIVVVIYLLSYRDNPGCQVQIYYCSDNKECEDIANNIEKLKERGILSRDIGE